MAVCITAYYFGGEHLSLFNQAQQLLLSEPNPSFKRDALQRPLIQTLVVIVAVEFRRFRSTIDCHLRQLTRQEN